MPCMHARASTHHRVNMCGYVCVYVSFYVCGDGSSGRASAQQPLYKHTHTRTHTHARTHCSTQHLVRRAGTSQAHTQHSSSPPRPSCSSCFPPPVPLQHRPQRHLPHVRQSPGQDARAGALQEEARPTTGACHTAGRSIASLKLPPLSCFLPDALWAKETQRPRTLCAHAQCLSPSC